MPLSFVVDLHNLHVIGFAGVGSQSVKQELGRDSHKTDPSHFLHTASLLALASTIRFAGAQWTGPGLTPRSLLALKVADDVGIKNLLPAGDSAEDRAQIARNAASRLAADMDIYCATDAIVNVSSRTPTGLGSLETDVTAATRALLVRMHSIEDRARLYELHKESPNNTSLLMLTLSDALYDAIHGKFWPSLGASDERKDATNRLETLLRMYTYLFLSSSQEERTWYSPAFDRLAAWRETGTRWANAAQSASAADPLDEEMPILLDNVSRLLLKQSDGHPYNVLRLALRFREVHGAAIDSYLPQLLTAYESREDTEVGATAEKLHDVFKAEFSEMKSEVIERLGRFLAVNGKHIVGSRRSRMRSRGVLVKSDIHDERARLFLEETDEFIHLGRRMDEGVERSRVAGRRMSKSIKDQIQSNPLSKQLVEAFLGDVVIMAGTGITIFTTGDKERYTWKGLIHDGLDYVAVSYEHLKDRVALVKDLMDRIPDSLTYRYAGDVIRKYLHDAQWNQWLHGLFGSMKLKDTQLIEAILALGKDCFARIATTNYDLLFERDGNRKLLPCVPSDEAAFEDFLSNSETQKVLHVHGSYDRPDSIVLGSESYGSLNGSHFFDYINRLFDRRLVFIGFSGFDDPTFARLEQYQKNFRFRGKPFVLLNRATQQDWSPLVADGRVIPIVYGDDYAELPGFLDAVRKLVTGEA